MPIPPDREEILYTGQLRRDIELFRGQPDENGLPTWVIFDPVSDKYYRICEREYLMISLLYENRPVNEFYDKSISLGSTIDRAGIFNVIAFLMNSNLMMPVYGSTEKRLWNQRNARKKSFWTHLMQNYLFFKIPLVAPDNFIGKTAPFVQAVFNKWTLMMLALISAAGYLSVVAQWSRLIEAVKASLTLSGAMKYALAIAALKVFHELAHAYTAKSQGVRVRRFGIGIMVFFPRLFTDLTDSWRIASSKGKAMIDGAGIALEILAGGFAALFWLNSPPSAFSTICYYLFAVSVVNTIFVNGNPFIKYDGYYLLMDMVNIDNLQQRSFQAVNDLMLKHVFGIRRSSRPILANPAKNTFLTVFGVLSFLYRIFLYTSIIMIIYYQFTKTLGIALIMLEIYLLVVSPLLNQMRLVMAYKSKIKKFNVAASSVAAVAIAACLLAPIPWSLTLPCEIKADDTHVLYAPAEGFLQAIYAPEGGEIPAGGKVATLSNPNLELDIKRKRAELKMAQIDYDRLSAAQETFSKAETVARRIGFIANDIAELERRLALLEIKSSVSGQVCYYDPDLKISKWMKRGEVFGEVFNPNAVSVIAYAKESEAGKVKPGDKVAFSLNGELATIPGVVTSVNMVPERAPTPSPLLSSSGGPLKVKDSPNGPVFEEPVYQIAITPADRSGLRNGRSGLAFIRKPESLAVSLFNESAQWLRKFFSFQAS